MLNGIPWIVHAIALIVVLVAGGGLFAGLNVQRDVDDDVKLCLSWGGLIVACIDAMIIAFDTDLQPIGYEVAALVLCLSCMLGFLGIGLCIGPRRGQ